MSAKKEIEKIEVEAQEASKDNENNIHEGAAENASEGDNIENSEKTIVVPAQRLNTVDVENNDDENERTVP